MRKQKVIDLFAGCGGLTEGFEQSGLYETMACVEWDKAAHKTLSERLKQKWNYSDAEEIVLRFDIQRTKELFSGWKDDSDYGTCIGLDDLACVSGGPDLIIGGPPCQAYSIAGRVRDEYGMHNDYRNYLFESYLEVVERYKPKAVLFENVPGMLSAAPGGISIIDRIRKAFSRAGYELIRDIKTHAVIDFTSYGVPQKRKRVILFALKKDDFPGNIQKRLLDFYSRILPEQQEAVVSTVNAALKGLDGLFPAKEDYRANGKRFSHRPEKTNVPNHCPRYHNRRDIKIFRDLAYDIASGTNKYVSADMLKELYQKRTGKRSNVHKYYVLRKDEPSNTIPAHLYKDGLRHIHPDPDQARSITVREAARLQSFDDDYIFMGSSGDQYKMIGNAVPPLFAKKLAEAVYNFLSDNYQMKETGSGKKGNSRERVLA